MSGRITAVAPDGVGEVVEGDDLASLFLAASDATDLDPADGDILTVTSKVVSKAEGRHRTGDRMDAIVQETVRVVARRGPTTIVRNQIGLTMAAAGVDASNVIAGTFLLLPEEPDRSARLIREAIQLTRGVNVGVLVTDTAGRPWRNGQTDIAIGAAGVVVLHELSGQIDGYGNPLAVTAPAVADELAGLAELASGKLSGRPFTLVRGRDDLVLPAGEHGIGAGVLIREDGEDMFGFGSREAVVRAISGVGCAPFGSPAGAEDLLIAVREAFGSGESAHDGSVYAVTDPESAATADVLARAFGWQARVTTDPPRSTAKVTFQPAIP